MFLFQLFGTNLNYIETEKEERVKDNKTLAVHPRAVVWMGSELRKSVCIDGEGLLLVHICARHALVGVSELQVRHSQQKSESCLTTT